MKKLLVFLAKASLHFLMPASTGIAIIILLRLNFRLNIASNQKFKVLFFSPN
jgi:hypothetical protein